MYELLYFSELKIGTGMSSLSRVGLITKSQKIEVIDLVSSDEEKNPPVETDPPTETDPLSLKSSLELEVDDPPTPRKHTRLKKKYDQIPLASFKLIHPLPQTYHHANETIIDVKDDSDEEELSVNNEQRYQTYVQKFPSIPRTIIEKGLQAKLIANVYLRKVDKTANVFIPYYVLEESGIEEVKENHFRTPKGEICIFASGGLQNTWEKTVSNVFYAFFGEKVKIIRASWVQKHLYKDCNINRNIEDEFKGRETELHSEFFYDLFFRHFFAPKLNKSQSLNIYAYSWWDACNQCEGILSKHQEIFKNISYKIAASRRYFHRYPPHSVVEGAYVPKEREEKIWKSLWSSLLQYVRKPFRDNDEKYHFWTATREGLEMCKWIGQAFIANKISPKGYRQTPMKKGDVLYHYANVNPKEAEELQSLIFYLREVNWELSCWYKLPRLPDNIQKTWNKYWKQVVVPHFGWEDVYEHEVEKEDKGVDCEMCGYPDLHNVYLVHHKKYKVSEKFLQQPLDYQLTPAGNYLRISNKRVPAAIKDKRKDSICVGSECIQVLSLSEQDILDWRNEHPLDEEESKFNDLCDREEQNLALEQLEKSSQRKRKG